ncbi:DsbA family oxidoreductase [Arenicella sp. 4NH20-0111]|uniref:DsbA family oxidoreductase n=1 Tax=Arenicella sp. 4NH20-0111 TaxID=3127648 RepID=UPI0031029A04
MKNSISIQIVSDVSCPWCIIGYKSLQAAIDESGASNTVDLHWRPFELNPTMALEGQDRAEHLQQKYGGTEEQMAANRQAIQDRGLAEGYEFKFPKNGRVYNTFNAHRLIHWAAEFGLQTELKLALFDLFFQQGGNPSDEAQLLDVVAAVGLDAESAKSVLGSNLYEKEVRADQALSQQQGISSVPAFIFNNKYMVSGGQPKETFINVLKQLDEEAREAV